MDLSEPVTEEGRGGLAELLADPSRGLLAVDFDGTLAPIVDRPADARPAAGAVDALTELAGRLTACAVISGRPADEAVRIGGFAAVPGLEVLGHYGLQRWRDGRLDSPAPSPAIGAAREKLAGLLADAPDGVHVEDKTQSLAVHTRPAADPAAALASVEAAVRRTGAELGLEVVPGRFVLELRPPGVDKGNALQLLLKEHAPSSVVFIGDDLGDLPAFDVIDRERGPQLVGCKVASVDPEAADTPPEVPARADLVLAGPEAVVGWLRALAERLR